MYSILPAGLELKFITNLGIHSFSTCTATARWLRVDNHRKFLSDICNFITFPEAFFDWITLVDFHRLNPSMIIDLAPLGPELAPQLFNGSVIVNSDVSAPCSECTSFVT